MGPTKCIFGAVLNIHSEQGTLGDKQQILEIYLQISTQIKYFIQKDELCGRPFHLQSHLAALNVVYSAVGLFVVASDEAF